MHCYVFVDSMYAVCIVPHSLCMPLSTHINFICKGMHANLKEFERISNERFNEHCIVSTTQIRPYAHIKEDCDYLSEHRFPSLYTIIFIYPHGRRKQTNKL